MCQSLHILPEVVKEIHQGSEVPSTFVDFVVEEVKAAAFGGAVQTYAECFRDRPELTNAVLS